MKKRERAGFVGHGARRADAAAPREASPARYEGRFAHTEITGERASNGGVVQFTIVVFALVFCVTLAVGVGVSAPEVWTVAVAVLLATLASMSVHIAQQW